MLRIPKSELKWTFSRSSGPGGQNVNKVNTKATLRWDFMNSTCLSVLGKARFYELYHGRCNSVGEVIISSSRFRERSRNVEDCIERLCEMIGNSMRPVKKRKRTKPTKSSNMRRLADKKKHSQQKALRLKPRKPSSE